MAVAFYMDQHVPHAITVGLRLRGVDVVTAFEDGADRMSDPELLDRAGELGRALFIRDDDLLAEGVARQRAGATFQGVVFAHQLRVSIGVCVHDLEIIAKVSELEDLKDQVVFLPL